MRYLLVVVMLVLPVAPGCRHSDAASRRRAASIQILKPEQVAGRQFAVLAEVSGQSCARGALGGSPSMDAALEDLRREAAEVAGAVAVLNVLCDEGMTAWCPRAITCTGDAVSRGDLVSAPVTK